jgi:hypothetical protein
VTCADRGDLVALMAARDAGSATGWGNGWGNVGCPVEVATAPTLAHQPRWGPLVQLPCTRLPRRRHRRRNCHHRTSPFSAPRRSFCSERSTPASAAATALAVASSRSESSRPTRRSSSTSPSAVRNSWGTCPSADRARLRRRKVISTSAGTKGRWGFSSMVLAARRSSWRLCRSARSLR